MKKLFGFALSFGLLLCFGCEYSASPEQTEPAAETSVNTSETEQSKPVPSEEMELPGDTASSAEAENSEESDTDNDAVQIKEAKAGVTHKGEFAHSSEHPMSIVDVPLATYFTVGEKTVFDMQIPQAMSLYQATNGEYPQTEEEFMREIIQANNIKLPQLKEGDTYFYDPKTHQLMVRAQQ